VHSSWLAFGGLEIGMGVDVHSWVAARQGGTGRVGNISRQRAGAPTRYPRVTFARRNEAIANLYSRENDAETRLAKVLRPD
jgi:hypothetical protein